MWFLLSFLSQEQNYPPEVSGVIPSIIQSTFKVYNECVAVLLKEDETRLVPPISHCGRNIFTDEIHS